MPSILRARDNRPGKIQAMRGRMMASLLALFFSAGSAQAQTFQVLHVFQGRPDGQSPQGGAIADANGNVYGTTYKGGS